MARLKKAFAWLVGNFSNTLLSCWMPVIVIQDFFYTDDPDGWDYGIRIIMLVFIIFEITAQAYLVSTLYSFKAKLDKYINEKILKMKLILVSILIIVAIMCIPIIIFPGDKFKFLKHLLEWDYFLGVITFYLLTYFMWKKKN